MKLRPYQEQIIAEVKQAMMRGNKSVLMQLPTGGGKTFLFCKMVKAAYEKGKRVYVLCHRQELISQASEALMKLEVPHSIISAGSPHDYSKLVQVCSIPTLIRRLDKVPVPDLNIWDECLSGDTEILTEKGWQRFDELEKGIKVAQVEAEGLWVSWAAPLAYIQKRPSSKVVDVKSKTIDLTITERHQMLVQNQWGKREVQKKEARELNSSYGLFTSGMGAGPDKNLSPLERFCIAYSADGQTCREGAKRRAVRFGFAKERKIERLAEIAKEANLPIREVKGVPAMGNQKPQRRFSVDFPQGKTLSKNLGEHFDITIMSHEKALAIIEEVVKWDGHSRKSRGETEYSTTIKENADFIQAVGVLSGRRASVCEVPPNRHGNKVCYVVHFSTKPRIMNGAIFKKRVASDYKGDVYCVQVPKGNIIVRRNGKPLVVGNCHHLPAKSWASVFEKFSNAYHIGASATPSRLDGKGLGDFFTHMVKGPSIKWLIDNGFLSDFRYFARKMDMKGVKLTGGDYNKASLAEKMQKSKITGDFIEEYLTHTKGKKALVFCPTVEFCEKLVVEMTDAGITAAVLDGGTESSLRAMTIKRFKDGDIDILVNCELFMEGFNVEGIEVLGILRPTESLTLHLQMIGRALRTAEGKDKAIILDHAGNALRHGLPDDDRDWTLQGQVEEPKGEKLPSLATCDSCFGAFPPASKVCPYCGSEKVKKQRVIRTEKGRLQEIKRQEREKAAFAKAVFEEEKRKRKQKKEQEKAAKRRARAGVTNYQEAVEFAEKQNYDPAWAVHFAKAKGWEITE